MTRPATGLLARRESRKNRPARDHFQPSFLSTEMKFDHLFFEGAAAPVMRRSPRREEKPVRAMPQAPSPEVAAFFARLLGEAGLPARAYRSRALERRLPACLRFLRVNSPEEGLRRLEAEPALATAVLNVVLLGVTEFFRDRGVFETLRDRVLPELRSRRPALVRLRAR